jgi:hypothetical protein
MTLLLVMLHTGTMFAVIVYFWQTWRGTYFQTFAALKFWAEGHEFQAGSYVFDNEVPGFATIHREGTNSGIGVSLIFYTIPQETTASSEEFVGKWRP